jgi:Leucine-rich repeat (LRR) protein
LAHLTGSRNLKDLNLQSTQIGDAGLKSLTQIVNLERLNLVDTKNTDASLEQIGALPRLAKLRPGERITDSGLRHLAGSSQLRMLDLSCTAVTDAGLEHLKGLTGLERLDLDMAKVTDAGVASLNRALPKLFINQRPPWELSPF